MTETILKIFLFKSQLQQGIYAIVVLKLKET